jgi:hypothetical protein
MNPKRRHRGFERAGAFKPAELGLPSKRSKELTLGLAWTRVAGEAISRSAPAAGIRRGTFEVEVAEGRWAETMIEMMPRLASRLASEHPELGIRKWRLLQEGTGEAAAPAEKVLRADQKE